MTTFDDRERAFEAKFAHDAEMQFRVEARRNKLLGAWAAGLLGLDAEAYALEVVKSDFAEAGDEDVLRKLAADLDGKVTATEIRAQMDAFLVEAKVQLAGDY